jgi:hypothetical protein
MIAGALLNIGAVTVEAGASENRQHVSREIDRLGGRHVVGAARPRRESDGDAEDDREWRVNSTHHGLWFPPGYQGARSAGVTSTNVGKAFAKRLKSGDQFSVILSGAKNLESRSSR